MLALAKVSAFAFCFLFWTVSIVCADDAFENTAIVRSVELGGSLTHISTTYAAKALQDNVSQYTIALSEPDFAVTSWIQVKVKGQAAALPLETLGHSFSNRTYLYSATLKTPLHSGDVVNLVVETVQSHASYPWPASAAQKDAQLLKYNDDLFVLSPYYTKVQRTKFKSPSNVLSFTIPGGLENYTSDPTASKTGNTVTYGPYNNISPSSNQQFQLMNQQRIVIHHEYDEPVLTIATLNRAVEISHWGSNMNIQDDMSLRNDGPKLKGQFSRLEHQKQKYAHSVSPQTLESFNIYLPAGVQNPYFYDLNGNVSTSRFRPSSSNPKKGSASQYSVMEVKPRYPILGGWNYTFTLGWDAPLGDNARFDANQSRYILSVPIWTPLPGAVVDDAEISLILPEGATDVQVHPPFLPLLFNRTTHTTYLDTIGRPMMILSCRELTDMHTGIIYISYKVPIQAHLRKPFAVAGGTFGLFLLNFITKRMNLRIQN